AGRAHDRAHRRGGAAARAAIGSACRGAAVQSRRARLPGGVREGAGAPRSDDRIVRDGGRGLRPDEAGGCGAVTRRLALLAVVGGAVVALCWRFFSSVRVQAVIRSHDDELATGFGVVIGVVLATAVVIGLLWIRRNIG